MIHLNDIKKLCLALGLAAIAIPGFAKSEKRGVSENEFRFVQQAEALLPGVGWFYTWGGAPHQSTADVDGFEFVPMAWNASDGFLTSAREYIQTHPNVKYILGYNEPNFTSQANMTPAEAAEHWPEVQALAKEFNLKIVAPALNYSNTSWQPVEWMTAFDALVGRDAYDYTAIHSYGGTGVMQNLATQFHDKFGKDVWVTEFCYWPGEAGYVAPQSQIATMIESVKWLEKTPWIHRYAWFKSIGQSSSKSGPNYGLLLSGRGDEKRELSEQGYVYVYMTDFNPEVFHPAEKLIPASEYIDDKGVVLGKGAFNDIENPLHISGFSSGAYADYQFDVPEAGDYTFRIYKGGFGEPTRFDPCLAIYEVKSDGSDGAQLADQRQFALPNSDTEYQVEDFKVTLKAGKQTLRIKDMYPFQPSGITIPAIALYKGEAPEAGVEEISTAGDSPAEYYTLQGLKATTPLKPGFYIEVKNGVSRKILCTE